MVAFRKIHIPPLRFATCSRFQKEFLPCRIKQRASMIDGAYTTAQAEAQTEAYHLFRQARRAPLRNQPILKCRAATPRQQPPHHSTMSTHRSKAAALFRPYRKKQLRRNTAPAELALVAISTSTKNDVSYGKIE